MTRSLASLVGALLIAATCTGPANAAPPRTTSPAAPSQNQACTDNVGVTVVVDFGDLGGGVNVRCAPGPVSSGLDAMSRAGVAYRTTLRFNGFVCRIAGQPASDPCQTASPANAYWSYWIAARGGSWCYSNFGAGSRTPPPGSIEGWSFALNRSGASTPPPRYPVPAAVAGTKPNPVPASHCTVPAELPAQPPPPPSPATTPRSPTAGPDAATPAGPSADPMPTSVAPRSPVDPGRSAPPSSSSAVPSSTTPSAVEPGPKSSGQPAAAPDRGVTAAGDPVPLGSVDLSDDHTSGGSPIALVLGVLLISLIGAGAWARTRSRKPDGGQGA